MLNPDYYAALLYSKTMKGNVLKVKNSLNAPSGLHQYGTIRKTESGDTNGLTLLLINYNAYEISIEDDIPREYSK